MKINKEETTWDNNSSKIKGRCNQSNNKKVEAAKITLEA